uniref:Uncharacterized protein n=1 Tax=Anopheles farauti TaxID=69004 RepID=A0A182Q0E4_9DIPT
MKRRERDRFRTRIHTPVVNRLIQVATQTVASSRVSVCVYVYQCACALFFVPIIERKVSYFVGSCIVANFLCEYLFPSSRAVTLPREYLDGSVLMCVRLCKCEASKCVEDKRSLKRNNLYVRVYVLCGVNNTHRAGQTKQKQKQKQKQKKVANRNRGHKQGKAKGFQS